MSLESLKSLLSKTLELKANTTVSVVTLCVSCSNPAVQVEAVENGALQTLLTTLATAQQLRVQKKVSTPTQLSVYVQKVGDNTLHRELDKRRQLDLFRFVKMLHLSSRKLSRLPWLVRMRTATDTHTQLKSVCVYVCVFVLSRFCLQWLPSCVTSPMHSVTSWHVGVCRSCQSCSGLTTVEFCVHASSPCYTIWLLRRYSRHTLLLLDSKPSAVLLFKYKV